jgi:hypothetical protein
MDELFAAVFETKCPTTFHLQAKKLFVHAQPIRMENSVAAAWTEATYNQILCP